MKRFPINIDFIIDSKNQNINELKAKLNSVLEKSLDKITNGKLFKINLDIQSAAPSLKLDFNSHVTFFEVSSRDPIIMYKAGYHMAKNATVTFIQSGDSYDKLHGTILNDIVLFQDIDNLIKDESNNLTIKNVLKKEIEEYFFPNNHLSKFWFDKNNNGIIYIVGGPDEDKSKSDLNQNIYDYGDKDTFIETCIFLAKNFIGYRLKTTTSNDKTLNWKNNHLVVIGGPGLDNDPGNSVCAELMKEINSIFCYGLEYKSSDVNNGDYYIKMKDSKFFATTTKVKKQEIVTSDYGYFACFVNPHNKAKRVILINGIHTLGVLGAFRILTDSEDENKENCRNIIQKFLEEGFENLVESDTILGFECFFEVNKGDTPLPSVPIVRYENINILHKRSKIENFDIFLSYSSKDKDQTQIIKNELENKGISTFMAPWDMEIGDWKPQIESRIKNEKLKVLVLVLTEHSQESEIVKFEIETALNAGKEIIAYQLDDFKLNKMFIKLISGNHNILAFNNYLNPIEELIIKITNYLKIPSK